MLDTIQRYHCNIMENSRDSDQTAFTAYDFGLPHCPLVTGQTGLKNGVDSDQMSQNAMSDQVLHYMPSFQFL